MALPTAASKLAAALAISDLSIAANLSYAAPRDTLVGSAGSFAYTWAKIASIIFAVSRISRYGMGTGVPSSIDL